MDSYNLNSKICRGCLEENGIYTSIFSKEYAMMPSEMLSATTSLKISENDGLPGVLCSNCIYRLSVSYHFKQQCENSDLRMRQYLGIRYYENTKDAETNTECFVKKDEDKDDEKTKKTSTAKRRSRYKPKNEDEKKKRGPKPTLKVPQTCFQCHKNFKCAAQLQSHIRTHSNTRLFSCDYCQKRFGQKHNLVIHIRTHTGVKPFQCDVCGRHFSAHGNFIAHKKIHSGIRDQVCPVCSRSFITSSDLSRHMITHTGIKNYHCDVCQKSFSRNRDMIMHKRKIHLNDRLPISSYKCSECRKVFPSSATLEIHIKSHAPPITVIENHSALNIAQSSHLVHHHPNIPIAPTALVASNFGGSINMLSQQRLHPY